VPKKVGEKLKKIKVGVIGCGHIAQQAHLPNYFENAKCELVAICEADKEVLAKTAEKYAVKHAFEDYQELLRSGLVQAVSVCVPTKLHSQVVVEAAKNGVHVLCEKPLALDLEEADRMLKAASNGGIRLSVGYNLRFLPNHLKVKEYIENSRIGKPIFAKAQLIATGPYGVSEASIAREAEKRVGCLFDLGAHLADLMIWMFGKPSYVSAYFSTHVPEVKVDDSALTSICFESGLMGEISVAWAPIFNYSAIETSRQIQVTGTRGILESDIFGPSFQFYSTDSLSCKIKGKIKLTPGRFDPKIPFQALSWSYKREIEDFLESVARDKTPSITGEDARKSLRLILAAYDSYRTKSTVSLR
jgi:UDP-N-acetylglucosamine 3-dehydrogenase